MKQENKKICQKCGEGIIKSVPHSETINIEWCNKCTYFKLVSKNKGDEK